MKISFLKIIFTLVFFLSPFIVLAGTEHNMSGWAWSSNVGWFSFNSTNMTGSINYGVNKETNGDLKGYAWSSNIGWIQFGNLSGIPNGGENAKLNGNNLTGWARALSNGGGWDGWISLSGITTNNHNYGITLTNAARPFCPSNNCSGDSFAWGSDVIGWADFNGVIAGAVITPLPDLIASPPVTNVTLTSGLIPFTSTIKNQGNVTAIAGTTGIKNIFQVSKSSKGENNINGSGTKPTNYEVSVGTNIPSTGAAIISSSITLAAGTYYLRVCADATSANAAGTVVTGGVVPESNEANNCSDPWTTVNVTSSAVPVVTVSANPTSGLKNVINPTITWSATNNPTSCTATGDWKTTPAKATSSSQTQSQGILSIVKTYTYTLTCSNSAGTSNIASATVNVTNSAVPFVTLLANPTSIVLPTGTSTGSTVLSWSATNGPIIGCTATSNPVNTNWNGNQTGSSKTISGLGVGTYIYNLTCSNSTGASILASKTVTVTSGDIISIITITGTTASPTPNLTSCVPATTGISVSWTLNGSASYNILRSETLDGGYAPIATSTTSPYLDLASGLTANKTYYYVIRATGATTDSNKASAKAPAACSTAGTWGLAPSCSTVCGPVVGITVPVYGTCSVLNTCLGSAPSNNCTVTRACVAGVCPSPANHLSPCSGNGGSGTPSAIINSPSDWTWTCTVDTPSPTCLENNVPGNREH